MTEAPAGGVAAPGPLAAPAEDELVAAYAELRGTTPTLSWAATDLGRQPSELLALAEAGELVVVPGPWRMRQAHGRLGCFVPTWQLAPGGRSPAPGLGVVIAAAAAAGWTSLRLHRFMSAPLSDDGTTPAALLRAGDASAAAALVRGRAPARRPLPRTARATAGNRRPAPRAAARRRPLRGDTSDTVGAQAGARDPAAPGTDR